MVGNIVEERWDDVKCQDTSKDQLTYIESLIHTTKNNQADYPDFDKKFYKFPAYYRRSVINFVVGQVKSYHTRLDEYEEKRYTAISAGKKFKERRPTLNLNTAAFPSMYKDQMYILDRTKLSLKVRIRNTWDWVEVSIKSIWKTRHPAVKYAVQNCCTNFISSTCHFRLSMDMQSFLRPLLINSSCWQ